MQIFHDRKADRITIAQEAHPIVGWAVLVPVGMLMAGGAVYAWFEQEYGAGITAAISAISAAAMLWLAAWTLTEIVATFDGKARSLTVRRERPWGRSSEAIAFSNVLDLELTEIWMLDHTGHRLDIMLPGERRVRLRVNDGDRDEAQRAIAETRGMLRRAP